jgi:hypothetical protein
MAAAARSNPTVPDYDESGVDLSLIRCTLALTPAERLRVLQQHIHGIVTIRNLNARN